MEKIKLPSIKEIEKKAREMGITHKITCYDSAGVRNFMRRHNESLEQAILSNESYR